MQKQITGTSNKVIEIDLSNETFKEIKISQKDRKMYLGGKGLGMKLLYDKMKQGIDPLSEENIIAVMTGVYMGTGIVNSARFAGVTKSPLTGIMASSSCGGEFGIALKTAGYDGMLLTGKAKQFSYLMISNGKVEFKNADFLKGLDTEQAQNRLNLEKKDGALVIGLAGENLVKYANITSGHRYLGRGGFGAVMGSKNIKAVVAKGGEYKIIPKDKQALDKVNKLAKRYIKDNFVTSDNYKNYGTNSHILLCNNANILPVRNFKAGQDEKALDISGQMFKVKHNQKYSTCKPCNILCGHEGTFNGKTKKIPEYESTALLGPNLGIFDTEQITELNEKCNLYGLDTISTGTTLSYLTEATEKDLIKSDCKFGDYKSYLTMIDQIANRTALGNEVAEGVRSLSEKYGGKEFAIHVKGMEMSAYDPRGAWGQGLSYAVANRGACHLSAPVFSLEATLGYLKADTTMSKAYTVDYFEKLFAAVNSLHGCQFTSFAYMLEPVVSKYTPKKILGKAIQFLPAVALSLMDVSAYSRAYQAITGIKLSQAKMFEAGERIHILERYMNTREGISKKDDTLPARMLNEGLTTDKDKKTVPLEKMLKAYYKIKGFDKNGIPKKEKLEKLGIEIKS